MGRQRIYHKHVDDDDLKAINPSCMWGLMNVVDYHQWGYSVKRLMLPYKGNHVKHLKGYQIPKYDYDEQQETLLQEEEKKKEMHIDHVAKRNGSTKKKSIKSRLKSLIANRKQLHKHTKDSSRRKLKRTYSIHHLGDQDHDHVEKHSNWDHRIIIIPGKNEVNIEESGEKLMKLKENGEFVNVLDMLKVDKRLFLEIMKNSNDGIMKTSSLLLPTTPKKLMKSGSFPGTKLMKSGSFPGTKSTIFNPSKLKDKQSFLKWEKFPDVVSTGSFKDKSHESFKSIKLGRALSLILASTIESDQEDEEEEEERRGFKFNEFTSKKNAFSHQRSISLNESMDKYVNLFGNDFKKEGKLHQSRSLRLRNEDEKNPRLFSRIGSLSNVDLYNSIQYEEPNFADWTVTFSEEINEDLKVDHDHTYEVDDIARFRTESFSGECSFRVEDLQEQYNESNVDTCPEKNTIIKDVNADEFQESCIMSQSSIQSGLATIDDFKSVQGVENKYNDNIDQTLNTEDQAELEYIRHILEFSGITKDTFRLKWQSSDQPLKPCLFYESCRPEDLERFTEDLGSFYYYQLLFDLINEEFLRLSERLSTYYPKALSYSCHVGVFPVRDRVVEEIISSGISKLMNFKPCLDSIIEFDLKKNDEKWMNLQWESESVALEVDHMIFEDLLKELVC